MTGDSSQYTTNNCPVMVQFINNSAEIYGENGLSPSTPLSVGIDLRACITEDMTIQPGERAGIGCGIALEPKNSGIAAFIYSRSGLGAVSGIIVAQGVGVIDPDYRGELKVFLLNTSPQPYTVRRGDRIAQVVFQPYVHPLFSVVETLSDSSRGSGGFGHTGKE